MHRPVEIYTLIEVNANQLLLEESVFYQLRKIKDHANRLRSRSETFVAEIRNDKSLRYPSIMHSDVFYIPLTEIRILK